LPALLRFDPELIVLSAGFDGRHGDPVGGKMGLTASDYEWATRALVTASAYPGRACNGRIVRLHLLPRSPVLVSTPMLTMTAHTPPLFRSFSFSRFCSTCSPFARCC
jgi:hypothetical protein